VLLVFGVASLLLAALYLFGQRDIKRLLAYSSVEHMGILAVGVSFGAPAALAGVLLHVLAHAAAKGNAFMGAGVLVRKFGTNRIADLRGGLDLLPWSGPLFLLAIFALGAMPPFGLFRSEFEIVAGGLGAGSDVAAAILIVGVTVAFFGLAASATGMLMRPARRWAPAAELVPAGAGGRAGQADPVVRTGHRPAVPPRGEPSGWMVLPVAAGALVLLLLGVHPPAELNELFDRAVRLLSGAGS
jgi:hydrogenase-4 component F